MSRKIFVPLLIILLAVCAGLLTWSNSGGSVRPILLFLFMLICPGLAFTRLLHLSDLLAELVLAIAISLAISTLLAEVMVLTRFWAPSIGLLILIGITIVGASLQLFRELPSDASMEQMK